FTDPSLPQISTLPLHDALPIWQVVPGDTGDGRVTQPHGLHALRHPPGFVPVQLRGLAGVDLAEVAPPGALVATDEEGGLAVLPRSEEHTSELQSRENLVCRLLL